MESQGRGRPPAAIAGAFLFALLFLPASAAAEGWGFKFASPVDREADQVKVGVDKDGNVTAIWRDDEDIKNSQKNLTIRSSLLPFGAAGFEAPVSVTTNTSASDPQIGVTENGTAVAIWRRFVSGDYKVEGTTRTIGTWNGATEISEGGDLGSTMLTMAMAKNGNGVIGWRTTNSPNRNNLRLINGANFAALPTTKFDTSPYPFNNEPDVAVSPDGSSRFLIGHKYDLGSTRLNLYTNSGIAWDAGVQIADPGNRPALAVAQNGEPVSAWMASGSLFVKRGTNATVPIGKTQFSFPEVAVGPPTEEFPNGMVVVAWLEFVDDGGGEACCDQVRASIGDGVTMSAPIELSDEIEDVENGAPEVAVGPDGTAYVAWSRYDGSFWIPQASVRPPKGAFPAVADNLSGGDAYVTDLVTAADGRAIVGIKRIDSKGEELYFRAATAIYEPPPAPVPAPLPLGPPAPPGDTKPPKVKVRLSRAGFTPGDKLNQVAVKAGKPSYVWKSLRAVLKEGTRVLVTLDEPASIAIRVDKTGCFTGKPANPARSVSSKCNKSDPDVQHFKATGKTGLNKYTYLGSWPGERSNPAPSTSSRSSPPTNSATRPLRNGRTSRSTASRTPTASKP